MDINLLKWMIVLVLVDINSQSVNFRIYVYTKSIPKWDAFFVD